ncbi:MAG: hypothetical protein ACPLRW_04825 [Moorellales bacterium]
MRYTRLLRSKRIWLNAVIFAVIFLGLLAGTSVPQARADLVEKVLAAPFDLIAAILEKLLGMYPPDVWIYAGQIQLADREIPEGPFSPRAEIGGVLTGEEWDGIVWPWFGAFQLVAWVLMGITVVYTGLRIAASKDSARSRAEVEGWVMGILIGALVIAFFPYFVEVLFDLNLAIVKACARAVAGEDLAGFMSSDLFRAIEAEGTVVQGTLAGAIVRLVWISMTLYFCIRYLLRKLMVMFLVILAPLAGWAATWQRNKTSLFLLLGELTSNIFVQSAHALALTLIIAIWSAAEPSGTGEGAGWIAKQEWWIKPAMLSLLIPISGLVGRLINTWLEIIGINEDQYVGGAMRQLGGIAGVAAVVGSFFVPAGAVARLGRFSFDRGSGPSGGGSGPVLDAPSVLSGGGAAAPSGGNAGVPSAPSVVAGAAAAGRAVLAAGGMVSGAAGAGASGAAPAGGAAGVPSAPGIAGGVARGMVSGPAGAAASSAGAVSAGRAAGAGGVSGGSTPAGETAGAASAGAPPAGAGFGPSSPRPAGGAALRAAGLPGRLAYGAVRAFGHAAGMALTQRNPATGEVMFDGMGMAGRAADPLARLAGYGADRAVEGASRLAGRPLRIERRWGFDDHSWVREV